MKEFKRASYKVNGLKLRRHLDCLLETVLIIEMHIISALSLSPKYILCNSVS